MCTCAQVGVDEDCAQRVASQISGALCHLHRLGFVHRDVKPENIFLCDRECRWVKLGDFGMAKAQGAQVPCVWYSSPYCTPETELARDPDPPSSTTTDTPVSLDENGNPVEELKKKKSRIWVTVEPSTDNWALGMLIYALLTGMTPWGETASDNLGYAKYKDWVDRASERSRDEDMNDADTPKESDVNDNEKDNGNDVGAAPQFTCFTSLACSLFLSLLHPDPELRGRAGEVEGYLGSSWLTEEDRRQREEAAASRKQREIMDTQKETERVESRDR